VTVGDQHPTFPVICAVRGCLSCARLNFLSSWCERCTLNLLLEAGFRRHVPEPGDLTATRVVTEKRVNRKRRSKRPQPSYDDGKLRDPAIEQMQDSKFSREDYVRLIKRVARASHQTPAEPPH